MTGCHELFSTNTPCFGNFNIRIANGSISYIVGNGFIKISNMTLNVVFSVLNLTRNLVSISKIDKIFELCG